MEIQIITLITLVLMIAAVLELRYQNNSLKKINIEDKIGTHLNKPLTIKDYEKAFKSEFKPYPLEMTSKINEDLFDAFEEFYETRMTKDDFIHPTSLHIIFLNKIDGYIYDSVSDTYDLIIKQDQIPITISDKKHIKLIDASLNLKYTEYDEFNIDGIIRINNKDHFLSDLTSISTYKTTQKDTHWECSYLLFNFGPVIESIRFDTFGEAFDYLFNNDKSDIRLIEKIANTSLIIEKKGEL